MRNASFENYSSVLCITSVVVQINKQFLNQFATKHPSVRYNIAVVENVFSENFRKNYLLEIYYMT